MACCRNSGGCPLLALVAVVLAPQARAAPGGHIRAGDAEIVPSVLTGSEYHSNVYLVDGREQPEYDALAWVVRPSLDVALAGRKVKLAFGADWGVRKYLDFRPDDGVNLQNADHFSDVDARLGVDVLPESRVGVHLDDRFRVINAADQLPSARGSANIVHLSNDADAGLTLRPGGGAVEIGLLGALGQDRYTLPAGVAAGDPYVNDRTSYGPVAQAAWRFLPRTSLVGSASVRWTRWENHLLTALGPEAGHLDYGTYVGKPDATAWRATVGVRGPVTTRIAAEVSVGLGQARYDERTVIGAAAEVPEAAGEVDPEGEESFARDLTSVREGLLVDARVTWTPSKRHTVVAGYRKDFEDAYFTNYTAYNALYLRYRGRFGTRVGFDAEGSYRIDAWHGEIARGDQTLAFEAETTYDLRDYLAVVLAGGWDERACLDPECEDGAFYTTQYDDGWARLGVTFTY